jgi:hypothetical protein
LGDRGKGGGKDTGRRGTEGFAGLPAASADIRGKAFALRMPALRVQGRWAGDRDETRDHRRPRTKCIRRVHVTEHRDPRSDMGVGWVMVRKGNGGVCEFEHMQTDTKM